MKRISKSGVSKEAREAGIQTLTETGKPVADRLATTPAARLVYAKYRQALVDVARADARVISLHRGTAPYKDSELRALGQGWRANLNLREMKGIVNNRADTAYDLHMEIGNRIKVTVRPEYRDVQSPNPQYSYGEVIAEEYTYMLNFDWPENYLLLDQISRDRIKLGLGVASWKDELDWRPIYMPKYSFFTDPLFPPLPDSIPACVLRDTLLLRDVLPLLEPEKRKSAAAAGWNIEELRKLVLSMFSDFEAESNARTEPPAVRDDVVGMWSAFEAWQASRPAGIAVFELERIPVVRYLMTSVSSGRVSHYIDVDPALSLYEPEDFIYKQIDQFEKMSHALWLAPYSYAEGTVGSLDGLGHDLAPYCEISNRMLCTTLDGAMMSGGLVLQASQGWDGDELSVLRIGPTTVIPPSLQAVQSSFSPPVDKLLDVRMAVRGVYSNNVGMTRMNPEQMEIAARGTRSTQEVVTERQREFRLEANSANFEYLMWTNLHREMFRRAVNLSKRSAMIPGAKEAKAFRERCVRRGVPEVLFDEFEQALIVEVNRAVGGGSPASREQTWAKLMQLRGSMDEAGRRHTEREYAAALLGYRYVDDVFPLWNRDQIPVNEKSVATLENNDFREGSTVPAGSDQIHVLHLGVHLEMLMGMANSYEQAQAAGQVDYAGIIRTLEAALTNCMEHVNYLARDKTRAPLVKKFRDVLSEIAQFYKRVQQEAAKDASARQQMAQEQQSQMIAEAEAKARDDATAKLRKVELDAQIAAMHERALADSRQWAKEASEQLKRDMAEGRNQLEREMAERRMALEEEIARRKADLAASKTD